MKIVSIHGGHDANITFSDTDLNKHHIIEIERLVKKRYFRLHVDNSPDYILNILKECQSIAEEKFGFDNDYDCLSFLQDGFIDQNILREVFNFKEIRMFDHHLSHAASTFYQSPFDECLIVSYDGGGNDGFFNVYRANSEDITLVEKIKSDFGGGYLLLASCCTEITKGSRHMLSLAGKLMGLCAYGNVDMEKVDVIKNIFVDRGYKKLSETLNYDLKNVNNPWKNPLDNYIFEGQDSYDFAANSQRAYETMFLELFDGILEKHTSKNVCISGGGGLNVLLNQIIKNNYDLNIFVSPNPNDCGLSLGASFLTDKPKDKVNIAYNGLPLLDISKKEELLKNRSTTKLDLDELCKLLKEGKIIGVCRGDSEVGPRALGNRSIICDPSFKNMKDILNSKVKFREWFRPFAPFCLKEDASKYFESKDFENMEFMGYAPLVKEEYQKSLPSITHVDGSSRLQTVTEESHQFFYDLLKTYSKYSDTNVLLNTSFNIRGNPILSTIEDALYVLDNTELDYVLIDDVLVKKESRGPVTIVTSLYNINRSEIDGRKWEEYLEWFSVTLKVKCPMVIFVEDDMVDFVETHRKGLPTKIISMPLEKIPYYHLKGRMDEVIESSKYQDKISDEKRIECKSSLYNIIQYSKFKWIEEASDKNYFDSEYFVWMDAGLSRFFYDIDLEKSYPGHEAKQSLLQIRENILIQVFTSYYPDLVNAEKLDESYFLDNRSFVGGGIFGASQSSIKKLCPLIEEVLEKMLSNNTINNEQIALGYLYKNNSDLFAEFLNDSSKHRNYELICELAN